MKVRFDIALLGRLQVSVAGRRIELRGRKEQALLAYLAMSPGEPRTRDELCGLLWSERTDKSAHDSLKQTLHRLRLAFASAPSFPVLADRTSLTLDQAAITIDLQRCERLIDTGATEAIEEAIDLWRGTPLEGLDIDEAAFDEWLAVERRRLRGLQLDIMNDLLDRYLAADRQQEAIGLARRLLALDPLRESTHRALMRAYAGQGQTTLALQQYRDCCAVLQRELDVQPEPATTRLYHSLVQSRCDDRHTRPSPLAVSIAVLPFQAPPDGNDHDGIGDGMAEDIATDLSRWLNLAVWIGPIQGADDRPRFLVSGSLRRKGPRFRITARLIDGATGQHVWAERFDRDLAAFPAAQEEVTRIIVGTVAGRVLAREAEHACRKPWACLSAQDLLLRGNALSWDVPATAMKAQLSFERAIAVDPGYGRPYCLLATMLGRQWRNDPSRSRETLDRAFVLAERAVALADGDSTCHMALAYLHLERRNFDMALRLMERGVELNPANPWNRVDYGSLAAYMGRAEEAVDLLQAARRTDPYIGPAWYWRSLGMALFLLGRYAEALVSFERSAAGHPRYILATMAACCAKLGHGDRTSQLMAECLTGQPTGTLGNLLEKLPFKDAADRRHLDACLRLTTQTPRRIFLRQRPV